MGSWVRDTETSVGQRRRAALPSHHRHAEDVTVCGSITREDVADLVVKALRRSAALPHPRTRKCHPHHTKGQRAAVAGGTGRWLRLLTCVSS